MKYNSQRFSHQTYDEKVLFMLLLNYIYLPTPIPNIFTFLFRAHRIDIAGMFSAIRMLHACPESINQKAN